MNHGVPTGSEAIAILLGLGLLLGVMIFLPAYEEPLPCVVATYESVDQASVERVEACGCTVRQITRAELEKIEETLED